MLTVYSWSVDASILNDDDDVLPTLAQGSFLFRMKLQRLWLGIAIQEKCVSLEVNPNLCHFGWISKFIIALKAKRPWTGQDQDTCIHNSRKNINFHSKCPTTKNRSTFKMFKLSWNSSVVAYQLTSKLKCLRNFDCTESTYFLPTDLLHYLQS